MRPFECNRCHARSYHEKRPQVCSTCNFDKHTELQSICLLLPVEVEPSFPVIHTSGEVPSDDGGVASIVGQKWVAACKRKTLPLIATAEPSACTCYKCLEYIKSKSEQVAPSLPETVEQPGNNVIGEFEGFEDTLTEAESLSVVESTEPDSLPSGE